MTGRPYGLATLLGLASLALAAAVVLQARPALGLGEPDPTEQADQANDALSLAVSTSQLHAVEAQARDALRRAPLEASAVSLLGLAEAQQDRPARAGALMTAANTLSHRDSASDLWLFARALDGHRYAEAFRHGDALLRRDQTAFRAVMNAMANAADDPAAIQPLAARLALSPSWRENFFVVAIVAPPPRFIYPLFEAMRAAGSPPQQAEMESFLNRLTGQGEYEQAYLIWMLSLTSKDLANLGYIYDGDFEGRRTLAPFGWTLASNEAGMARIAPSPHGGMALEVDTDGFAPGLLASQLLVLPPGAYRLTGKEQPSSDDAADALRWTLTCERGPQLAEISAGLPSSAMRAFATDLVVPPEGCAGQRLELKARAGERHGGLTVWYDDLNIIPVRVEEAP